jgi:lauroyl/myristoyl acyltransferase
MSWGSRLRSAAAGFWLGVFFFLTQRAPWIARAMKRPLVWLAIKFSRAIREGTAANGRRILPSGVSQKELSELTRGVVMSFYDFVCDVGQSLRMTRGQLAKKIEAVEGHDKYLAARSTKRGAIILTAHIGSFEVGMAALLEFEKKIHVVFKRDIGRFEQTRQAMRKRLGVVEQAVDDGWEMWMRLRDALAADEVVAIQGDRVMPGQKGVRTAFLFGHMLLPSGPVKLAIASGAPIIPVFSVRSASGKIRLFIEDTIIVGEDSDQATKQIAAVLAKYVAAYKEQWQMLHPAFCEGSEVKAEVSS